MPVPAIIAAFICLFWQPLAAEPHCRGDRPSGNETAEIRVQQRDLLAQSAESPAGDALAGRGPGTHAATLRQIAIYAAIGNREGVEILTAQLRAVGVSTELVFETVTWLNVHNASPSHRSRNASRRWPASPIELASETMK